MTRNLKRDGPVALFLAYRPLYSRTAGVHPYITAREMASGE